MVADNRQLLDESHDDENEDDDRILSLPVVCDLTTLSRTTLWREQKHGRFPPSVQLSPGRVGVRQRQVRAWIAAKKARST